jgi:hypothetical protein
MVFSGLYSDTKVSFYPSLLPYPLTLLLKRERFVSRS